MAASAGFFLSPQQKFIFNATPDARTQIAVTLSGELDVQRLKTALLKVVSANDVLRTIFQRQMGMVLPFQVILDECEPIWIETVSGPDTKTAMEEESKAAMPPDASQLRSATGTLPDGTRLWILTAHAAIADAASMQLIVAETLKAYTGASEQIEDAIRYVQFAQWQNDLLAGDDDDSKIGIKFWEKVAQSAEAAPIPGEGTGSGPAVGKLAIDFTGDVGAMAEAMDDSVTASDIVLAAWASVIARWTGRDRVQIGVVLAGRGYDELVALIGTVAKMCPLTIPVKGQVTFADLAGQVYTECEEIISRQEYCAPSTPFKIGFEHVSLLAPSSLSDGALRTVALAAGTQGCALKLNSQTSETGHILELQYDKSLFSDDSVAELAGALSSFLSCALASPRQTISCIPMVSTARKSQMMVDWAGPTASFPSDPIHALISAQALRTPAGPAVQSGAEVLTYAELESRSNQLARYLAEAGVKPGSLVGLCVARSAAMMVPVLAILKAGGAYVPLSADQPKARTAQQLGGIEVLLTESEFVASLPDFSGKTVILDAAEKPWQQASDAAVETSVNPDDLAYVIYTSGSTGAPKGVGVRHRNLVNYATHIVRELGLDAAPLQFATVSTLAADLGNTVIYPALLTGGCLHVLPYDVATDARQMAAYQTQYGIDVLKIVPSHLAALLEGNTGVLPRKFLITGGEALKPALVDKVLAHGTCEVVNHYGPTETTVGSLMLRLKDYDWKGTTTVPIGRPIANTRVYVLDQNLELLPVGVAGELYIAGAGVTAGYIGETEKNLKLFVTDPFRADAKMYRTGDLVRWLPTGVIEFLGRADDQVKIRGFRVELGEIETTLAAEPGVRQCVVLARAKKDDPDDKLVVAYVVLDRQQASSADGLKAALKEKLPDYMVPAAMVVMAKLPLTTNGKVDRKSLPAPEERASREYKAPATATEELVAQIWSEVLKVDRISTDENFFDLGGHSLLATQVISRLRESMKLEIALRTMFESPVLRDFSAELDKARASGAASIASAPIQRVARQAYRPDASNQ